MQPIKRLVFSLSAILALTFSAYVLSDTTRPKANFPHTDIFVFDLTLGELNGAQKATQTASIANPINATKRQGYDNQPYFTPNSKSFIFARGDDYQTDAYEYDLATGTIQRLTDSDATEFSPTPISNNTALLFVSDRNGSVWRAERDTPNKPEWLLNASDNCEPIGYFALNEKTQDFLYWSRYGFSLALVNLSDNSYRFVAGNTPPSTPHVIPQTNLFSFVHRQTNEQVWIKTLDPSSKAITPLIAITGSNFNYTWAPDRSILMIQNDILFQAKPFTNQGWTPVASLTDFSITNANRLAVSPDGEKLAVVGIGK